MELETRVYQKENTTGLFKLVKASLRDIYASRFLSRQLAVRDIKAQYRQSFLGILWAFITPIATALVWIILNGTGTVRLSDTGIPYPVYAFSGTLLWSIMSEAINSPMQSTRAAKGILSKINFPKEALVVSGIYKLLFNSLAKVLLLLVFIFLYGIGFHSSLLLFPLAVFGGIIFGTTLGLFITPLGLLYQDVGKFIAFGLRFAMYATPVVYAVPATGIFKTIMEWNPFTPFITVARNLAVGQPLEYLGYFGGVLGISLLVCLLGLAFYRFSIPILVERLSS